MVISQENSGEVCCKPKRKGLQVICFLDEKYRRLLKDYEGFERKVQNQNHVYTRIGRSQNRQMLT